jgi:succinoglycan biosynthesis transport protein ExoP
MKKVDTIPANQLMENSVFSSSNGPAEEDSLRSLALLFWRRKYLIIAVSLLCGLLGTFYAARQRPIYTVNAVIAIDTDKSNGLSLQDIGTSLPGGSESQTRLETQALILQSQTLALSVIDQLHLEQNAEFKGGPGNKKVDEIAEQNRLLGVWGGSLSVQAIPKTKLLRISYRSHDPKLAAQIINALIKAYVQRTYQVKFSSATEASTWLSQQLKDIKARSEEAEHKLAEYQQSSGIIMLSGDPEGGGKSSMLNRLEDLNRAYTMAEVDRIEKESRDRVAQSLNPDLLSAIAPDTTLQTLRAQQATLSGEYAQLNAKYDSEYPRVKELKSSIQEMQKSIDAQVARTRDRIHGEYLASQRTEKDLAAQLDAAKTEAYRLNERATQLQLLQRDARSSRELYESLLRRLNEAGVVAGLQSNNVEVVDYARIPNKPTSTAKQTYVVGGLLAGFFIGCALALVLNSLDGKVSGISNLQEITNKPVLAIIPHVVRKVEGDAETNASTRPSPLISPKSQASEAFRTLRTSLLLSRAGLPAKVIVITSTIPGEGKSFTSLNLAIVLAEGGSRVLLVDADMRRGKQHLTFDVSRDPGLSSVLSGVLQLDSALHLVPEVKNLTFLACGPTPPHPADLLQSSAMSDMLELCNSQFDFIVLDTPPVLLVSDALILSNLADLLLLVTRSNLTTRHALRRTGELLSSVGNKMAGTILNDDRDSVTRYGSYGYYEDAK